MQALNTFSLGNAKTNGQPKKQKQ
jgi:hypothetical protein